ncbi:MAG: tetratricopeptide repeat protein [Melioribacteraceae bacterium]|nr:tetratricopeptide repeat protein [Melioribacteraceae bacterium]
MRVFFYILILAFFTTVINAQPKQAQTLKRQAVEYLNAERYGEAIELFNKFIISDPQNPEGYNLRAICYENRKQYAWARVDYRRAYKLDRTNPEYQKNLARLKTIWYPQLYEKIDGHRREIEITPDDPFNYLEIANSYRWLEEWEDSELWYDRYLAMDEDASPDEIIRYTNVLAELKHVTKGERVLRKYTVKHPDDWRIWSRHGYFLLWLGRNKDAEQSFLQALAIKPFFKESEEGLDLARRTFLTEYTPGREYPIDKYFRILRNDPNNDAVRFQLIDALMEVQRYDEALDQIEYLRPNYEGTEPFDSIESQLVGIRQKTYEERIAELLTRVENQPTDRIAVRDAAEYYSKLQEYDKAMELINNYLSVIPEDAELHFLLSKIYSYDQNFTDAYIHADQAALYEPNNSEYNLFSGQLGVWLDTDLDLAEERLMKVYEVQPENLYALITLGTLNFQKQDYDQAEFYISRAEELSAENPDVVELVQMIELQKLRNEEARLINNLDYGRQLAMDKECGEAVPYYEEFLGAFPDNMQVRKELADVYLCMGEFDSAIEIYDEVLSNEYTYDIDKMRGKIVFWSGDSTRALEEFTRLVDENPADMEAKLFLGDSYLENSEFEQARNVYTSLADSAPASFMIEQRLSWLPPEPVDPGSFESWITNLSYSMFSYANVYPVAYFFNDNLNFNYYYLGTGLEFGLLDFVSGGMKWYTGQVSGVGGSFGYTQFMGQLLSRITEDISLNVGYGLMNATNYFRHPVWEASAIYRPNDKPYKASASYVYNDAAAILYSPYLVLNRLDAHNFRLEGDYLFRTGLKLFSYYQLVVTEESGRIPANVGNIFQGRIGKHFLKDLMVGYEYHFIDYQYTFNTLYYSPQGFESHSIWADWFVIDEKDLDITTGGKLGYVPSSDFLVREAYIKGEYRVIETLFLTGQAFIGSSFRESSSYDSGSITVGASWKIY